MKYRGSEFQNFNTVLANEDDLQSKTVIKEIVLRIVFFYSRIDYRRYQWKHLPCVLRNHRSQKKTLRSKLAVPVLANEDDLQSKSVIKEIVLRIVFYISIDYRHNESKQFVLSMEIHSPLAYSLYM